MNHNHLSDDELKREFGIAAHGWRERSEAFTDAFEVCSRPSFGKPKHIRVTYDNGTVVHRGKVLNYRKWLRERKAEGKADHIVMIEKLWPETDEWEVVYRDGKHF